MGWLPSEVPSPDALKPPAGQVAPLDGNTVLWWNSGGTGLWITQTFAKLRSPLWKSIMPLLATLYLIKQAIFDPFYMSSAVPVYALASNRTNSRVYYTANALAGDWTWIEGTAYSGLYNLLRTTSTPGSLFIYAPSVSAAGTLYLAQNDMPGAFGDNTGSVSATISINGGAPSIVTVPGTTDAPGVNTGITVSAGDLITITASGSWCFSGAGPLCPYGPEGSTETVSSTLLPTAPHGALIGRLGTSGS